MERRFARGGPSLADYPLHPRRLEGPRSRSPPASKARKMIDRVDKRLVFKRLNDQPGQSNPGRAAQRWGWNCSPKSRHSSFHTTICVLEGLLDYERAGRKSAAVTKARKRAENYLLERRMFRPLRTGEVVDKLAPLLVHDVLALQRLARTRLSAECRHQTRQPRP